MKNMKNLAMLLSILSVFSIALLGTPGAQAVNYCTQAQSSGFFPLSCSSSFTGTAAGISQNNIYGAGALSNLGLTLEQVFEAVIILVIILWILNQFFGLFGRK